MASFEQLGPANSIFYASVIWNPDPYGTRE